MKGSVQKLRGKGGGEIQKCTSTNEKLDNTDAYMETSLKKS